MGGDCRIGASAIRPNRRQRHKTKPQKPTDARFATTTTSSRQPADNVQQPPCGRRWPREARSDEGCSSVALCPTPLIRPFGGSSPTTRGEGKSRSPQLPNIAPLIVVMLFFIRSI